MLPLLLIDRSIELLASTIPTTASAALTGAMRRRSSLVHAVLFLLAAVALPLAAGQPWPSCGTGGTYAANSTYETNLLDLISALQGNASSSPTLYASGVVGSGRDTVYGVMLCRGDLSTSDCNDCGTRAGQDVGRVCNRTRDAALVYNQCYVRVSDKDFLASTNNSGEVSLMSSSNITGTADVRRYDGAVISLLNATVRYAVENSTRMFATGQRVGADPGFSNIYSMAQCSPELSRPLCRSCLDDLVGQWWDTFPVNVEGARIAGTRCNLRSELNQGTFYTGQPMVLLRADGLTPVQGPAPTATTGGEHTAQLWADGLSPASSSPDAVPDTTGGDSTAYRWPYGPRPDGPVQGTTIWPGPGTARPD